MLIVHVIIDLNVGGAELMLKRLVLGHHKFGARHIVISLTELGSIGNELVTNGIEVHALGMQSISGVLVVLWRLRQLLRSLSPDIVQTWMYHGDLIGGLVARSLGIKSVIWGIRSTDISKGGSKVTVWIRWLCAKVSHLIPSRIVCAAERSRQVHESIGYAPDRMLVIPNGFDLERFYVPISEASRLRADLGLDETALIIGFVGRFSSLKGLDFFVEAAALILQCHPNAFFLLVGRELDAGNEELMAWIAQTDAPDHFCLLGERSDVPTCLAAMDIFCLSSRTEGFPNVVGEAMLMGLPCVVTDVGDAAFLLGDTGIVVPKENHKALAEGILYLMNKTSDQRQIMGQTSRKRILDEFTMSSCIERFDELYHKVITECGRSR